MLKGLTRGSNAPNSFNVLIEIPQESGLVKYEIGDNGLLMVDRFLSPILQLQYPCNYGAIPETLGGDGDPVDVLVWTPYKLVPMSVIEVRPVAVLEMDDEKGGDEKIICVPIEESLPDWDYIQEFGDLPPELIMKIEYFFKNYKKLEKDKWVKVKGWGEKDTAIELIRNGIKRYERTSLDDSIKL